MIKLTREDWAEIYYALDTKTLAVKRGEYAPEDSLGQDTAWIAHIEAIKKKIGSDGSLAADQGVASAQYNSAGRLIETSIVSSLSSTTTSNSIAPRD